MPRTPRAVLRTPILLLLVLIAPASCIWYQPRPEPVEARPPNPENPTDR